MDPRRQERDVERAIGAVDQRRAEQIEDRAEESKKEVAQGRRQSLGAAVERYQRHRGEGKQLERDIEVEQIVAEKDRVQRSPHRRQQRPEDEGSARLRAARGGELSAGKEPDAAHQHRRGDDHCRGQPIGAQCYAERRRPAADHVLQRSSCPPHRDRDGEREGEPGRHQRYGDALCAPPAKRQRQQHRGDRQHDRRHEQKSAGCRVHQGVLSKLKGFIKLSSRAREPGPKPARG